jgi:hypothetical protein
MGVAKENRFKANSLREFHAASARRPLDERLHLSNRLPAEIERLDREVGR